MRLSHLAALEAQSIYILREVMALSEKPVMLYSLGKDSQVLMHLARKAFYPGKIPFPLMHVDTTWKFKAMYAFRQQQTKKHNFNLIVHKNEQGIKDNISPFIHGSAIYTDIMKTQSLKQALKKHQFDMAIGGARRDEEASRAKERIFSFRDAEQRWNNKAQRPELWSLFNVEKKQGESFRVFPLSNWTEIDVWQYIKQEAIDIVPLYYAAMRPVVKRQDALIMVDDDRIPLAKGERVESAMVRFRTLGCYPLTGAIASNATTLDDIISELKSSEYSERQGRLIDNDGHASMERKKEEGYF